MCHSQLTLCLMLVEQGVSSQFNSSEPCLPACCFLTWWPWAHPLKLSIWIHSFFCKLSWSENLFRAMGKSLRHPVRKPACHSTLPHPPTLAFSPLLSHDAARFCRVGVDIDGPFRPEYSIYSRSQHFDQLGFLVLAGSNCNEKLLWPGGGLC